MSFLSLERLEKVFPDGTRAVNGVSLEVERGELVVLLGPSGCGKTTTLRMIAGLERASAGRVVLDGQDVTSLPPSERDVGFVFQLHALYPHLTVRENIAFPLACAGVAAAKRADAVGDVARRLGLEPLLGRLPRELSMGDRQRVGLARAMVRRPRLWLMDEPLGSLDASQRAEACERIRRQQLEQRVTTIYVTHDQEEALRLADRVVVMSAGEILQAAPPREIYDEPATLFVARFVGSPGMNLIEGEVAEGAFVSKGGARVELPRPARTGPAVLGARPEHVALSASGPLAGEVALDAYAGACRHLHVEGAFGRAIAQLPAGDALRAGAAARLAIDPAGIRLFDPASGTRLA